MPLPSTAAITQQTPEKPIRALTDPNSSGTNTPVAVTAVSLRPRASP